MALPPAPRPLLLLFTFLLAAGAAHAQTGKLAGRVTDAATGAPLPGVSISVESTYRGAATDRAGYYTITNIPPGRYEVLVSFLGYKRTVVPDVRISTDFTTAMDFALEEEIIEGEEVVITADAGAIQRDLTSTRALVTAEEMEKLPVESIADVVNLQAGVVASDDGGFHFRGGRSDEVAVLVDGMSVVDPFSGLAGVQVEPQSIQEIEVISGTFNAEYGQAMSGIVNIVTKDGAQAFAASASGYLGSFLTAEDDLFYNIGFDGLDVADVTLNASGPLRAVPGLSVLVTGRYFDSKGSLYGRRVFRPADVLGLDLNAFGDEPEQQIQALRAAATGDSAFVPMNPYRRLSLNSKVVYNRPSFKLSYSLLADDHYNRYYDHAFRLNPDGLANHYRNDWLHQASATHVLSSKTFYTVRGSYNISQYEGHVYEDPLDERYVGPFVGLPVSAYTYRYGGQQNTFYDRTTRTTIGQLKLTSQVERRHQLGAGVELRLHELETRSMSVQQATGDATPGGFAVPELGTLYHQAHTHTPYEFSAYLQDKMEYGMMIINAGLRADYFNPNASQPADLRNPEGNANFPGAVADGEPEMVEAEASFQLSPRLGASFPITETGAVHFAYGHFFQTPTFENLYQNAAFLVEKNRGLSTVTGNPDLKPQRTVMYEAGIQQQVLPNTALDLTVYYRDIRNLLGTEIIGTYEGYRYARFINRDYGNVRGIILSLDRRFADRFSAKVDYTYQIAEGNASDPLANYQDNQSDPPIESEKKTVPLDWDQRHTLYVSAAYGEPGDWTVGLNFRYGSGMPYTTDRTFNPVSLRFENDGRRPPTASLDLRLEKQFALGRAKVGAFAIIYNALDARNEYGVYGSTGRANRDRNAVFYEQSALAQNGVPVIGLNTVSGFVSNPSLYSEPRQLRLGVNIEL